MVCTGTFINDDNLELFKVELVRRGYDDLADKIVTGYLVNTLSKEDFWLICKLDNIEKFGMI